MFVGTFDRGDERVVNAPQTPNAQEVCGLDVEAPPGIEDAVVRDFRPGKYAYSVYRHQRGLGRLLRH